MVESEVVWLGADDSERVEVVVGETVEVAVGEDKGEGQNTESVNDPVKPWKPSTTTRYEPCQPQPV